MIATPAKRTATDDTKLYDAGAGWSVLVTEKQGLMPAISLHIWTKKVLSARLAVWDEADKDQKAKFAYGCHSRQGEDSSSSPAGVGVSHQARTYASVGTIHPACDWHRPAI